MSPNTAPGWRPSSIYHHPVLIPLLCVPRSLRSCYGLCLLHSCDGRDQPRGGPAWQQPVSARLVRVCPREATNTLADERTMVSSDTQLLAKNLSGRRPTER
eukprot:5883244-Pyramimonas_sp.AAC.1